jgi:hypothetical protein
MFALLVFRYFLRPPQGGYLFSACGENVFPLSWLIISAEVEMRRSLAEIH